MSNQDNQSDKKTLFSTASKEANQVDLGEVGFNSSISQVDQTIQPKNPKDFFSQSNDSIVKNIVDQKIEPNKDDSFDKTNDKLLDEFAEIDKKLELKIESLESMKSKTKTTKLIFGVIFVFFLVALLFSLYFQGRLNFGEEEIQSPLQANQEKLYELQSELLLNQTKKASILLNQLAFQSSDFQRKFNQSISQFETADVKVIARNELSEIQTDIVQTLTELTDILAQSQSIYSQSEEFQVAYTEFLSSQIDQSTNYQGLSIFSPQQLTRDSSILVKNTEALQILKEQDLQTLTQADLLKLLSKFFSTTSTNYITDLANFTLNRVELTRMFSELTTIARKFDENFSPFNINENSTINFNNYTISANNTISVSADVKTSDQSLFSLIANLDDEISSSSIFQKVERTSYSKTLNQDGQFTSNVNLDIKIEQL